MILEESWQVLSQDILCCIVTCDHSWSYMDHGKRFLAYSIGYLNFLWSLMIIVDPGRILYPAQSQGYLVSYNHIWSCMILLGSWKDISCFITCVQWSCMCPITTYDHAWSFLDLGRRYLAWFKWYLLPDNPMWSLMDPGKEISCLFVSDDHMWSLMITCDHSWSFLDPGKI